MDISLVLKRKVQTLNAGTSTHESDNTSCPSWYMEAALQLGVQTDDTSFESLEQCANRVKSLALQGGFEVVVQGNAQYRRWTCKNNDDCPFDVRAFKRKSNEVFITRAVLEHSHFLFTRSAIDSGILPTQEEREAMIDGASETDDTENVFLTWNEMDHVLSQDAQIIKRHRTLSREEAARTVAEFVYEQHATPKDGPLITCDTVRTAVLLKYGVEMKSSFTSNVKKMALERVCGTIADGYRKLHDYFVRLAEDNHGKYSCFETYDDGTFRRCILVPGCFQNAPQVAKPLMSLDGAHLKGIYNKSGVFMAASMKDGSNCNLLVALAIVPVESEDNWIWFLQHLKRSFLNIPREFFFISDRDKGLSNAVKKEFPLGWHRYCMFHIVLNIRHKKIKISDDDRKTLYEAAQASTEDKAVVAMRKLQQDLPRAHKYLCDIQPGPKVWAQWAINKEGFATFGMKTSNASEENHSWIGILTRSSNPVSAYYQYMTKLQAKFGKRRSRVVGRPPQGLVEKAKRRVEESVKLSRQYVVPSPTCMNKFNFK